VADFKPAEIADHKLKKGAGPPVIQMASTEDILSQVSAHRRAHGWPRVIVGFAAESQDIESNARIKLEQKGIDLIVANDITAGDSGFAVDTNKVTLIDREGGLEELPLMSKVQVAERIVDRVVHWLATSVGKS
jgi:phosphopantothenoylcysteine decarboxylase/phosphopantothenate--cysteine ligase